MFSHRFAPSNIWSKTGFEEGSFKAPAYCRSQTACKLGPGSPANGELCHQPEQSRALRWPLPTQQFTVLLQQQLLFLEMLLSLYMKSEGKLLATQHQPAETVHSCQQQLLKRGNTGEELKMIHTVIL